MGEGIRDYIALRFSLQPIVPDGGGGLQRLIDVARVKEAVLLLGVIRSYAPEVDAGTLGQSAA